jgi:hypothetical protein
MGGLFEIFIFLLLTKWLLVEREDSTTPAISHNAILSEV